MKIFSNFIFTATAVLSFFCGKAQTNNAKFITAVTVEKTDTAFGVQGLQISYTYNFSSLGKQAYIDSIVKNAFYKIKTRIFIKNEVVNPGYGYSRFRNIRNDFEMSSYISSSDIKNVKADKQLTVFIPYAALKLPDLTNYTATVKAELISTESLKDKQLQLIEQGNISFYKPETLTATVYVDSIEVNTLDSKGQAWDYSFYGKDYPDIDVAIKLSNNILWNKHINNKFLFVLNPSEKNYSFSISKNDKITVLIEDRDLLVSDLIEKFECVTTNKIKGEWYSVTSKSSTVKQCKIQYRIN
ncbi:MAG: hypothetical protein ABIR78_04245 [Ferruginibacter sp.]